MLQQVLRMIEQEMYDDAAAYVSQRQTEKPPKKETIDLQLVEKILSLHKNLRSPEAFQQGMSLDENQTQNIFVRGEIYFLKGLLCFTHQDMRQGTQLFWKAWQEFQWAGATQRELLAHYNYFVGRSHTMDLSTYESMQNLNLLESFARECQNFKLLGSIAKQKALIYKQMGKTQAALEEAKVSLPLLEFYGSPQDYQAAKDLVEELTRN